MKKLNLILAGALLIGAVAVNAQDSQTSEAQDRAAQDRSGAGVGTQGASQDQEGQSQDQTGSQEQSGAKDQTGSQGANPTHGANPTQESTESQDHQKDMIVIKSSEVPTSLRTTLGGADYQGWESNSTIYRSRSNEQFIVEMRDGNQTKVHRFDKEGKVIQGQDQ